MKNSIKKTHLLFLSIFFLLGIFFLFGNIENVGAYIRSLDGGSVERDNSNFLNQDFWDDNPSDKDIIRALYGPASVAGDMSGGGQPNETIYTSNRDKSYQDSENICKNMSVVYTGDLFGGFLNSNTIYVLTSSIDAITTGLNISSLDCSAIVSNQESGTTLYSQAKLDFMIGINKANNIIIDNISINGKRLNVVGDTSTHEKNDLGVGVQGVKNMTFNNIKTFNNGIGFDIKLTNYAFLNQIKTYNNDLFGVFLDGINYSLINNLLSYNNLGTGIYMTNGDYNTLNNTQVFKNDDVGVYIDYPSNIAINNIQIYDNNNYGLYMTGRTIGSINMLKVYENFHGFYVGSDLSIKCYGQNLWSASGPGSIECSDETHQNTNWEAGEVNEPGEDMDMWDYATNTINSEQSYLYDRINSPDRSIGKNHQYTGTSFKYSYGSGILTQIKPVKYRVEGEQRTLDGLRTGTYNTYNYIGSDVPKVEGQLVGDLIDWWLPSGTTETDFSVSVEDFGDELTSHYSIFGSIVEPLIGEEIHSYTGLRLKPGYGYKKVIPQIWGNNYYATHRQKTSQNTCGGSREWSVEEWEECDLGFAGNGPNSACSSDCKWNIPSCAIEVITPQISLGNYAKFKISFPFTGGIRTHSRNFGEGSFESGSNLESPYLRKTQSEIGNINNIVNDEMLDITFFGSYTNTGTKNLSIKVSNPENSNINSICTGQIEVFDPCNISASPNPAHVNVPIDFTIGVYFTGDVFESLDLGDGSCIVYINKSGFNSTLYRYSYSQAGIYTAIFGVHNNFYPGAISPYQYCTTQINVIEDLLPELFVHKTMIPNSNITTGTLITYTINYGNTGDGTGLNVVLTDHIPYNFTGNRSHLGNITNGILTLFSGSLNPGQTGEVVLTGYATASGLLTNIAYISGSNHNQVSFELTGRVFDNICGNGVIETNEQCDEGSNNSNNRACKTDCTWNIPSCTLSSDSNTIYPGENINFTIVLSHNRATLNYLNFGNNSSFNFGGISGFLQTTRSYLYNLEGTYTPVVTIKNPLMGENIYCTGENIVVSALPLPNLFVHKTMSPNIDITTGTLITYTINYGNTGNGTGLNVVLTDHIPYNFTGNRSHLGNITNGILTLFSGSLNPGQTGRIVLTGYARASGLLTNIAYISGSNHDQVSFELTGRVFDNICGNGLIETNEQCDLGPNNSNTGACKRDCTWNIPSCNLSSNQTVNAGTQFTITGTVNQTWVAFSGITLGNGFYHSFGGLSGVIIKSSGYIYNNTGNYIQTMYVYNSFNPSTIVSCTGITRVVGPNLFVNKSISPSTGISMDTLITYTINYGNTGSGVALNVSLTDHVPSNFIGHWSHIGTLSGNMLRLFSGSLNPGQTGRIVLTGYATDRGQISNTVVMSGSNANTVTGVITSKVLRNICGDGIIGIGEYCDDGENNGQVGYCGLDCHLPIREYKHGSAGVMCSYIDEDYVDNGPFVDTINHRGYDYIETMRNSCLHRGRGTNFGLRKYSPDEYITKAEVLKTLVKIMGAKNNDFDIVTEDAVYNGVQMFYDVSRNHRFSRYTNYAYNFGLTDGLYSTLNNNKILKPDDKISRYDTIKKLMELYKKIISDKNINISSQTTLTDISSKNHYFTYVREAEVLGIISGVPQSNKTYKFEGDRKLTRAEFAKIIAISFGELLFVE